MPTPRTVTIEPAGGGGDHESLADAELAERVDLTSTDEELTLQYQGTWTAVGGDGGGFFASSNWGFDRAGGHIIIIRTDAANRHIGEIDEDLAHNIGRLLIDVDVDVIGLQVILSSDDQAFFVSQSFVIHDCLADGTNTTVSGGIYNNFGVGDVSNTVVANFAGDGITHATWTAGGEVNFCTIANNGGAGIMMENGGGFVVRNTGCTGNGGAGDFDPNGWTMTQSYNYSSDTSAAGTGSITSATFAYESATFFMLESGDPVGAGLYDADFALDILQATRPDPPSMGASEPAGGGGISVTNNSDVLRHYSVGSSTEYHTTAGTGENRWASVGYSASLGVAAFTGGLAGHPGLASTSKSLTRNPDVLDYFRLPSAQGYSLATTAAHNVYESVPPATSLESGVETQPNEALSRGQVTASGLALDSGQTDLDPGHHAVSVTMLAEAGLGYSVGTTFGGALSFSVDAGYSAVLGESTVSALQLVQASGSSVIVSSPSTHALLLLNPFGELVEASGTYTPGLFSTVIAHTGFEVVRGGHAFFSTSSSLLGSGARWFGGTPEYSSLVVRSAGLLQVVGGQYSTGGLITPTGVSVQYGLGAVTALHMVSGEYPHVLLGGSHASAAGAHSEPAVSDLYGVPYTPSLVSVVVAPTGDNKLFGVRPAFGAASTMSTGGLSGHPRHHASAINAVGSPGLVVHHGRNYVTAQTSVVLVRTGVEELHGSGVDTALSHTSAGYPFFGFSGVPVYQLHAGEAYPGSLILVGVEYAWDATFIPPLAPQPPLVVLSVPAPRVLTVGIFRAPSSTLSVRKKR